MLTSYRKPNVPKGNGPFRGIIITFNQHSNPYNFIEIFPQLTIQHPNFSSYEGDKHKCIIFYKNPYDVAIVIDKYQKKENMKLSIFYDALSKSLKENTLYLEAIMTIEILQNIKSLKGTVTKRQLAGVQIEFPNFRFAAIAYEELKKIYPVKFAYKSLNITTCSKQLEPIMETNESSMDANLIKIQDDIKNLLEKYKGWNTELKEEFQKAFANIIEGERKLNPKIKKTAENLELVNISWNEIREEEESPNTTPLEVLCTLKRMYENMVKNTQI